MKLEHDVTSSNMLSFMVESAEKRKVVVKLSQDNPIRQGENQNEKTTNEEKH